MKFDIKYTLFIADTHLSANKKMATANLLTFLQSDLLQKAEALYILGDFFMLWYGDDNKNAFSTTIKEALRAQTKKGKKIFLMPGNRDFLLGEKFAVECGITLFDDPTVINLYSRPTLLTHGDVLCSKDALHRRFRALIQNQKAQKIFFKLPLLLRKILAYTVHFYSEARQKKTSTTMNQMVQETAPKLMEKYQVNQIIHGHLHQQKIVTFTEQGKEWRRINLGNWQNEQKSILMYRQDGNVIFLE